MKTTIRTIIYAATVVLAAVSCQKSIDTADCIDEGNGNIENNENNGNYRTIDICVNGLMPEYSASDVTKAELVNTVGVSWSGGETVYVYDGTQYLGSLVASLDGIDNRYAKLSTDGSHTVKEPAAGTKKLTLVYGSWLNSFPPVNDSRRIPLFLHTQNKPTPPFAVFATLDYTGTDIKNTVVPFQFATSVIKVSCTGLKANTAISRVILNGVRTTFFLGLKGDAAPSILTDRFTGGITITNSPDFAADKVNAEGEAVFQIAVPVFADYTYRRVLIVEQGADVFEDDKFCKSRISAGSYVNTVCRLEKQTIYPDNAIHGKFSISESGSQVCFAKGNLKYTKTPGQDDWHVGTWGFFNNQYDCDPGVNQTYDPNYNSLFCWGYDGRNSVMPNLDEYTYSSQYTPGRTFAYNEDWGCAIGDGKTWRTLTTAEWKYLLNLDGHSGRPDQKRFALCKVDGYCGLLIFPDGWDFWSESFGDEPTYNGLTLEKCGTKSYLPRHIDYLSMAGVVFLPGAGARHRTAVVDRGLGIYWTSTCGTNDGNKFLADLLYFQERDTEKRAIQLGIGFREDGFSVRLAADL